MARISALCIGDELLDGRVRDKNAVWLAEFLGQNGLQLSSVHFIGDALETISGALQALSADADTLVVCGGMGPTADDITRDAAADWLGVALKEDPQTLAGLQRRFAQRGYPFTPNNHRQALFPAGAKILPSEVGTAAGFMLEKSACQVFFLPGVPPEYRWFIRTYLHQRLGERGGASARNEHASFSFLGIGESMLESKLAGIEPLAERLGAKVSYLANSPVVAVHLKAPGGQALAELGDFILQRAKKWLIAQDEETLCERLCKLLRAQKYTVTSAESCTAGLLAAKLAEVPGASDWFERGFVTYADAAKVEMLGVRPHILEKFGAVSAQTACQMAAGAQRAAGADFALATTGFAGPTGGTPDQPVGTIHFALATPQGAWHYARRFPGRTRPQVLRAGVYTATALLLWHLEGRLQEHPLRGPFTRAQIWAEDGIAIVD